ncbi:hypothetical protein DIPPA_02680 [Diplonema papillatum]|nr:hypothetical protein DIPPA_02680 [Diplonema papillatum]
MASRRNWQPPSGAIPLGGSALTDEEKDVARLKAKASSMAPPPPAPGPPACPQPGVLERFVGEFMSDEWKAKWKAWALECGVTPDMQQTTADTGEKPPEVMIVYNKFLAEFERCLLQYCADSQTTPEEMYALCERTIAEGGLVARYLSLVLDQSDFNSFSHLLFEQMK